MHYCCPKWMNNKALWEKFLIRAWSRVLAVFGMLSLPVFTAARSAFVHSACLSLSLSLPLPVGLPVSLLMSSCLSLSLTPSLPPCLSVCLSICQPVSLSLTVRQLCPHSVMNLGITLVFAAAAASQERLVFFDLSFVCRSEITGAVCSFSLIPPLVAVLSTNTIPLILSENSVSQQLSCCCFSYNGFYFIWVLLVVVLLVDAAHYRGCL